ncbi:hypothetical protein GCM10011369_03070 [Neiella marina]|uniref:Uncharacterized protein n=1 Tax=Neiella marina TaxID=508461 RepID=A0A8J2U250_9GAMM|nr:hypothetical protein [Neiella marina]GGA65033.1 hypothetical protein GCM10011369_03070 [Neiella marina]
MSFNQWKRLLMVAMWFGIALIVVGVGLIAFTDLRTDGVGGVRVIALTIGAGLLLLIPSKLVITLLLMMHDSKSREEQ